MTTYYVDSSGSNTAPYDTWAKAANSLATITAIDAAGDTIYLASTHSESGALTLAFNGTAAAPTKVISADKTSGAPPATIAAGASIESTSGHTLTGAVYCYGITFVSGGAISLNTGSGTIGGYYDSCSFQLNVVNSNSITVTGGGQWWKNCSVKFAAAGQAISTTRMLRWIGGSVLAGGTSPTVLFGNAAAGVSVIENVDLSALAASVNLFNSVGPGLLVFRNVKLPTNWSGSLNAAARATIAPGAAPGILINGDYAATNYTYQKWDALGDVSHETTVVMTGGSSDGTTTLSWKMVATASAGALYPLSRLECAELTFWNKTVGVARTVTLEYLHDSVTGLKNDEFWIEVDYLGSSGTPIGSMASSAKADVLQAGSTNPSSAAVWNTSGIANPNAQYVTKTFTPQMVGMFIVRVCLCKASYTVYVDRKVTVTT